MGRENEDVALPRVSPQRDVLLALAARCEAEEPSRDLDADIALTQGWRQFPGDNWIGPGAAIAVPPYTTSLDSAVTLVPPKCWRETNGPRRYLNIPSPSPNFWHCNVTVWEPKMSDHHGWGATEALSICAAALRARAQTAETRGDSEPSIAQAEGTSHE